MSAHYGTSSQAALRRGGFTLTELLVVVAIVILLVAIAMPIINMADKAGRNSQSKAVLQSLRTAVEAYRGEFGVYPPVTPALAPPAPPPSDWIPFITQPVRRKRSNPSTITTDPNEFGRPYGPFMASSANNFDGTNFIDGFLKANTYRYEVIGNGLTRTREARILWAGPNGVFETPRPIRPNPDPDPNDPNLATQFSPIPAGSDDIAG